jgi:hypothetical protein
LRKRRARFDNYFKKPKIIHLSQKSFLFVTNALRESAYRQALLASPPSLRGNGRSGVYGATPGMEGAGFTGVKTSIHPEAIHCRKFLATGLLR